MMKKENDHIKRQVHWTHLATMQFLGGAHAISGYNRIRDYIASDCSVANSAPAIEKRNLNAESNSRPGDIYLPT